MPRTPSRPTAPQDEPPPPGNSLIASAANLSVRPRRRGSRATGQAWQADAWNFFDTVGELRFGVTWIANAMSRVTLYVERDVPDGSQERVEEGPAADALDSVYGGEDGQSQMLATFGLHLSVPGEGWLIGEPGEVDEATGTTTPDHWIVASNDEVSQTQGGRWYIDRGDGKRPLADESLVIRIWRSHPRYWALADSSVRSVLPVLREIDALTQHVAATVDSRLAGAGVLLVPSEMSFATPPTDGSQPPEDGAEVDPFIAKLAMTMITALEDRGSAAALAPVIIKAPGALIGDVKHITFSTPLDEAAKDLRTEAIRRLALGLDLPPEVVLGQGDSNHWSAWQIEESALKVHIEPMCELVCAALTEQFLRPAMKESEGWSDEQAEEIHVAFDTADLRLRPDRSAQAFDLYDRIEIGAEALRREAGFEEEDAPTPEEARIMLLRKLATGAIAPEQAAAAAEALGLGLGMPAPTPSGDTVEALPAGPSQPPPEARRSIPEQNALLAAGEVLVLRALERANNRLNRRGKTRRPFTSEACDLALADAWDHAPRVAALVGADPVWYVAQLDSYTRALLTEGTDHTPKVLTRMLTDAD